MIIIDTAESHLIEDGIFNLDTIVIPQDNSPEYFFQYKVESQAYNLTGCSVYVAVKDEITSSEYKLDPEPCTVTDAENGKFKYQFTSPFTDETYEGVLELRITTSETEYITIARGCIVVTETII